MAWLVRTRLSAMTPSDKALHREPLLSAQQTVEAHLPCLRLQMRITAFLNSTWHSHCRLDEPYLV